MLVLILTISVGIEDRPSAAPQPPAPWQSDYVLFGSPTAAEAFAAISSIVFAYAGTPAFFNIVSEMREPRLYTRSLIVCQSVMTAVYLAIGIVVYYFCGSYVASPALGSAGTVMKKVCYGVALPGLIVSTTLFVHVCMLLEHNDFANFELVCGQILLHAIPPRLLTSCPKYSNTLDDLDRLHRRQCSCGVHYR
jgi:amino acid transporter